MMPKYHLIINFLVCLPLLFILNPIYVTIIFFSSVFIDIDHYFYYVLKEKDFSVIKAYKWFLMKRKIWLKLSKQERKKHEKGFLIFHGIEPLILVFILSKIFPIFFFIFIGFLMHMIEDLIEDVPINAAKQKFFLTYAIYSYYTSKREKEK